MNLTTPISALPKVGYHFSSTLKRLNIFYVEDLIHHYPFRYEDFSNTSTVIESQIGQKVTLKGELWSIQNVYTRTRKNITKAVFNDGTTSIDLTWFNSPWLTKSLKVGDKLQISGKVSKYKSRITIIAPAWEKLPNMEVAEKNLSIHTGRLVPVYPETFGLTSKWLRTKIADIFLKVEPLIDDPIPETITSGMLKLNEALRKIHFPQNYEEVNLARSRLAFDELFLIQLATLKTRSEWRQKPLLEPLKIDLKELDKLLKKLPFELTDAQKKVVNEILEDLSKDRPMNRLVQGEVGSGKTVVAAVVIYMVFKNNLKSIFMAPTEILAFQHYSTLSRLLTPLGVNIGIYTGSRKFTKNIESGILNTERKNQNSKSKIQNSLPHVIVGTHALLSDKLITEDVGLVIVDEQQRFGVEQRSLIRSRAKVPHFLTMTATPIPRTIALTMYGDLDLSIIDQLPKGRQVIKTHVVPSKKRADAYNFISKRIKEGDQVYIITPLIEPSETLQTVKAAKAEFETLKDRIFPKHKLGLLHGRLSSKEKDQVLNDFKEGRIDILVSTSVVEVGVDVPNATVMVIESSERFGLAQLHQLRGRVGRGLKQSYCLLFTQNEDSSTISRLKNLEKTTDGLKLAEMDMKIRGAGEIFGKAQSGRFEFKIADFSDISLIEKTRTAARQILEDNPTLDKYPLLRLKLAKIMAAASPD